jgi:hypothetical protein
MPLLTVPWLRGCGSPNGLQQLCYQDLSNWHQTCLTALAAKRAILPFNGARGVGLERELDAGQSVISALSAKPPLFLRVLYPSTMPAPTSRRLNACRLNPRKLQKNIRL